MVKSNNLDDLFNKRIPEIETLNMWEEHEFIDSPFVEIPNNVKLGNETKIIVDLQYPKLGMQNAIRRCLIRKEVLERLLVACTLLPQGFAFRIWDIYRTWSLQNELYYAYKPEIIEQFKLEDLSPEEQERIISNYVSIPNKNEVLPPLHTTGGSVDLTITDLVTCKDLDFGIEFDDFSDLTNTASYEKENSDGLVRDNRRLLYNIMIESGFTNLPSEVWHYDYGNRSWGYYKKKPAIYKGVLEMDKIPSIISFKDFMTELKEHKSDIATKLESYSWGYSDDFER